MRPIFDDVVVPPRREAVAEARRAVALAARHVGLEPHRTDDLVLAVSEAVTNAVEAHLATGNEQSVALACRTDGARLEISIEDRGHGFDVDRVPVRPPLSAPEHLADERGWGIQLMQTFVDHVSFDSSPEGTAVRLVVELARSTATCAGRTG